MRFVLSFVLLFALGRSASAQGFDSLCFYPGIGVHGEIDTIYGSHDQDGLGGLIKNLGPKLDGSYPDFLFGSWVPNHNGGSVYLDKPYLTSSGPGLSFNRQQAKTQKVFFESGNYGRYADYRFGHFRNRTNIDIFVRHGSRIYWADDAGSYDSTRCTVLSAYVPGYGKTGFGGSLEQPYIAHLTSDTVDDILVAFGTKDSLYLGLFKGGERLASLDTAYQDTSIVVPPPYLYGRHYGVQGDFHGSGREDLIVADYYRNVFMYRNEAPFSLEKLLHSIFYDTLWTRPPNWNDSDVNNQRPYWLNPDQSLAMKALPKPSWDKSLDWIVWIPTHDLGDALYVFRGGSDFGTHRITIDSAAYIIRAPAGQSGWPYLLGNAGDMTGTGNNVLFVAAGSGGSAYQDFYVTGKALDDKIDMYIPCSDGVNGDTVTADPDGFQDYVLGLPTYTSGVDEQKGKRYVGTIWVVHGSKQIPVHLNPKFAEVSKDQAFSSSMTLSPNPAHSQTIAEIGWPEAETIELRVSDMLGNIVQQEPIRLLGGVEQQRIYFRGLADGVYEVTLRGRVHAARARVVIVR